MDEVVDSQSPQDDPDGSKLESNANPQEPETSGQERETPTRFHLLIVLLAACLLCACKILPVYTSAVDEQVFLGFPYSIEDTLQYADFVAQARDQGNLLLSNRFTLADEDPRLIILPTYLTGRLAAWLGISVAGAWTLVQTLTILAFVWVLFWFLGALFPKPAERLFGLLFILFAGGLDGWVVLLGDLWPEAWAAVLQKNLWPVLGWTPYMTMYNPVYLAGWLVLLPWLRLMFMARPGRLWPAMAAAALLPGLYLVHAYDAAVAAAVIVLMPFQALLVRLSWTEFLTAARPVGIALLGVVPVVCLAVWQSGDPLFAQVAAAGQSGLFVSPVMWFLGFGGILAAAWYGFRRLAEDSARARLVFGWLVATAGLSFSPLFEGRHFLYFVSLPLGVAAVDGLFWLKGRFCPSRRAWIAVGVALALIFGNSFVRTTHRGFTHPGKDQRGYVTAAELTVAKSLVQMPPGGILSSRITGNWLPHVTGHRVVMGHWFLTHDMARKIGMFHQLVAPGTSPAERDHLLRQFGARYLFWGPREASLGPRPRTELVQLLPLKEFGGTFLLEIRLPKPD